MLPPRRSPAVRGGRCMVEGSDGERPARIMPAGGESARARCPLAVPGTPPMSMEPGGCLPLWVLGAPTQASMSPV